MPMYRFRRPPKNKLRFFGHELVRMNYCCTREAIRFFRDGNLIGVIQKNGRVAVSATGIFDDENNKRARLKVAKILFGLKMTSQEFVAARQFEVDEHERELALVSLKNDANELGFVLTPKPALKKLPKLRVDRTDPEGGIPGRA